MLNLKVMLFSAVWLLAIGSGGFALLRYQQTPGGMSVAPARWPRESNLTPNATLPTLLLFAHPKCPCTRATIGELAGLMVQGVGKVSVTVVFTKPPGMKNNWVETDLWRSAAAIPGVVVVRDDLGAEADVPNFDFNDLGHGYYASAGLVLHDMFDLMHNGTKVSRRQGIQPRRDPAGGYWRLM